jgi:D-xylose transport system substrate-binding protein
VTTLRRRAAVLSVAALALIGLAACSRDEGDDSSGDPGQSQAKKIALLLPESQTTRYESFDKPYFEQKVKDLCSDCEVLYFNANQQDANQRQQAQTALAQGANVIVLDPVDGTTAGSVVQLAKDRNVPVISYDRLIVNADIDYYVSFDNEKVGELQATSLVDKLKADGKTSGNIVMINGDSKDNNAKLFNQGARSVLDSSGFTIVPTEDFFTPDWLPANAQSFMNSQISQLGPTGFVGVYAANDGTAGGAIAAMESAGVNPLPPVTGQDAELAAIQRLVTGTQFMTVYKALKAEAEKAAELAVALAKGEKPTTDATVNNGQKDVPSALLEPIAVTKENIKDTVVADEFWTVDKICTADYAAACASAGLN